MTDQNPNGLPPALPGGTPAGTVPPGTVPPNALPPEAEERISGLMSNWHKSEAAKEQALGTVATQATRIAELETLLANPTSESQRQIDEAELRARKAEQENLQLRLESALKRTPNVAKAVERGTVQLEHVTSVEALFGLESTLAAAVAEIVGSPLTPPATPPVTPATPPSAGQPTPPTPETPPTPPSAGSMAAPADEPPSPPSTLAAGKRDGLVKTIETGDGKHAVKAFFPELDQD